MINYEWPVNVSGSGGAKPLRLRFESKTQACLNRLRARHVDLYLAKISNSLRALLDMLPEEAVEELYAEIGPVPQTDEQFVNTLDSIFTFNQEPNRPRIILDKLDGRCKDEATRPLFESIRADWNAVIQIFTDAKPESYPDLVRANPKPVEQYLTEIRRENGIANLSPELKRALSALRPIRLQNFVKVHQVGQGAYGDVWLAEDIVNKTPVALKKLKMNEEREGFPKNAVREILLLNSLKHKNIVNLLGISYSRTNQPPQPRGRRDREARQRERENVWMVFEYLPFDLSGYIEALKDPREKCEKYTRPSMWLSIGEIKTIMRQLLRAVSFCHKNNVLHRDLKTANLLMDQEGMIKLADFGLARFLPHGKGLLTNRVVTLWYRPPELLLGSESYDFSVDLWSVGCIMAELVSGSHIFAADKEFLILKLICENLGFPDEADLKYLRTLPLWNDKFSNPLHPDRVGSIITKHREFEKVFTKVNQLGADGWDLLKKLFAWSPARRISAKNALVHPWFTNEPLPKLLTNRHNIRTAHSFMTKNQRKRESLKALQKRYDYVKYANTGEIRRVLKKQLSKKL